MFGRVGGGIQPVMATRVTRPAARLAAHHNTDLALVSVLFVLIGQTVRIMEAIFAVLIVLH